MNQRTLLALLALVIIALTLSFAWRQTHHRSADQEILLKKAHQR